MAEQLGHVRRQHQGHVEQRPHAAAHRLEVEDVHAGLDHDHRRCSHRVSRANQRPHIAGVLQPVQHDDQLLSGQLEFLERRLEQGKGGHDALWRGALRKRLHHRLGYGQQVGTGLAEAVQ